MPPPTQVEKWETNPVGMMDFYQGQQYKLGQSIADLIDNSYDAGAKRIDVQIDRDSETDGMYIRILDDGKGIPDKEWGKAMMLGLQRTRKSTDLGVFGVGLKLSSLSQANEVTVASVHKGKFGLRRISAHHIRNTGLNQLLLEGSGSAAFQETYDMLTSGDWSTFVLLEDIHSEWRFSSMDMEGDAALQKEIGRIRIHLGLTFQKVLTSSSRGGTKMFFQGREIKPIDPTMKWEKSSKFGTIIEPTTALSFGKKTEISAMVTPVIIPHRKQRSNSKRCGYVEKGYKKANDMQGLYIYRNDRLIQYGGWSSLYGETNEEHNKLGKILIEIPAGSEAVFGLDPTKTEMQLPLEFLRKLRKHLDRKKQWGQVKKGSKMSFSDAFDYRYRNEGKKAKKPSSKGASNKGEKASGTKAFDPDKRTRKKPQKPKPGVVRSITKKGSDTVVVIDSGADGSKELIREIRRWTD